MNKDKISLLEIEIVDGMSMCFLKMDGCFALSFVDLWI